MFKGLGNLGDIGKVMKEAARAKQRMEALHAEMAQRTVDASSGGGMVTVKANGNQEILSVSIAPEVLQSGDGAMLEDLVAAACNAALERSRAMMREELTKITGGLGIDFPGLL